MTCHQFKAYSANSGGERGIATTLLFAAHARRRGLPVKRDLQVVYFGSPLCVAVKRSTRTMQLSANDRTVLCNPQLTSDTNLPGTRPSGGGSQPLCRGEPYVSLSHQVGGQLCEPLLGVLDIGQSQRSQVFHLPLQQPGLSGRQLPHDACDQPFPCPAQRNQCHFGIGSGEQLGQSAVVESLDVFKPG